MKCPQCGRENPDESRYCSNCLANLELLKKDRQMPEEGLVYRVSDASAPKGGAAMQQPPTSHDALGVRPSYHSVSEWREVAARQPIRQHSVRKRGIGGIKLDWAIYGGITLALIVAVLMMVTIWGNPMPGKVARDFMEALNRKDVAAMQEYVYSVGDVDLKLNEMAARIGEGGGFSELQYVVEESSNYESFVNIVGGTYNPGGSGFLVEIKPENKLMLKMESHEGHWYVNLSSSRVFP